MSIDCDEFIKMVESIPTKDDYKNNQLLVKELAQVTKNLYDTVGKKHHEIIAVAPEILDDLGKLSDIVKKLNGNDCYTIEGKKGVAKSMKKAKKAND